MGLGSLEMFNSVADKILYKFEHVSFLFFVSLRRQIPNTVQYVQLSANFQNFYLIKKHLVRESNFTKYIDL